MSDEPTEPGVGAPSPQPDGPSEGLETLRLRAAVRSAVLGRRQFVRAGRFELRRCIAEGGMGTVYEGWDPTLDRKVAIKILHDVSSAEGVEALGREAKALARVGDPNVVVVHEVGSVDKGLFVAMEFVEGETLREAVKRWREGGRPLPELLQLFVQAGRGLSAAHRVGLVHRDFKPENVLVGDDGRVRVTDFGLARAREGFETEPAEASPPRRLQVTDAAGTPAYMSPEQYALEPLDPTTDQFSFCVTLYEAVYGKRPFQGSSPGALARAMLTRDAEFPGGMAPRWLVAVLRRGLRRTPGERFESMDALLATLTRDRTRQRRTVALAGLGAGGIGLALWAPWAPELDPCAGVRDGMRTVWNDAVAGEIRDAYRATGPAYAEQVGARIIDELDAHAKAWGEVAQRSCAAAEVEHSVSRPAYLEQSLCLARRSDQLAAVVEHLRTASAEALLRRAGVELPPPELCLDPGRSAGVEPWSGDPETDARVDSVRTKLDALRVAAEVGDYQPDATADALADAEGIGFLPLEAEARVAFASAKAESVGVEAAEQLWMEALDTAERAVHSEATLQAYIGLASVRLTQMRRSDASGFFERRAQVAAERPGVSQASVAQLDLALGIAARRRGELKRAIEILERAAARVESLPTGTALDIATVYDALGSARADAGDEAAALADYGRALELAEARLGPRHPERARMLMNVAATYDTMGRKEDAAQVYRDALGILSEAGEGERAPAATAHENLGAALCAMGDAKAGLEHIQSALTTLRALYGADHIDLADTRVQLAQCQALADDLDAAAETVEAALLVLAREGSAVRHAAALAVASRIDYARGRSASSLAHAERGIEVVEASLGREHPFYFALHLTVARTCFEEGDRERAIEALETIRSLEPSQAEPDRAKFAVLDKETRQAPKQ